jgi:hypothetical protein
MYLGCIDIVDMFRFFTIDNRNEILALTMLEVYRKGLAQT